MLYTTVGEILGSGRTGRKVGRKAEELFSRVIDFIGKDGRAFLNDAGDLVVHSVDELREVRFDVRGPYPHQSPHVHVVEYERTKNTKERVTNERVYPSDVPHH